MKAPGHEYGITVRFYDEIFGFEIIKRKDNSVVFDFSGKNLWIDMIDCLNQAEIQSKIFIRLKNIFQIKI